MAPCGLSSGASPHCPAAACSSPAPCPEAAACRAGPWLLLCRVQVRRRWSAGEEGERGLILQEDGGGTAKVRLLGLDTASLCPLLNSHWEESYSKRKGRLLPTPTELGDTMSEACRCCLDVVPASSLRHDLSHTQGSLFGPCSTQASAQLLLLRTLPFAWWSVPGMRNIPDGQGLEPGCQAGSPNLYLPAAGGSFSASSSLWWPLCKARSRRHAAPGRGSCGLLGYRMESGKALGAAAASGC